MKFYYKVYTKEISNKSEIIKIEKLADFSSSEKEVMAKFDIPYLWDIEGFLKLGWEQSIKVGEVLATEELQKKIDLMAEGHEKAGKFLVQYNRAKEVTYNI